MRIAICDDETVQIDIITSHVSAFKKDYPDLSLTTFSCSEDLLAAYNKEEPFDLIFMDIEMKRLNGIDAAAALRRMDGNVIIVFISAHSGYVSGAFNARAFHYLLKPVKKEDFDRVFIEAAKLYNKNHFKYVVEIKNRTQIIEVRDIMYIETYKRKMAIYTADGKIYHSYGSLDKETEKLTPYGFVRTHQGFLVNANYIADIDLKCIHLKKEIKVPLSEHRKNEVLRFFNTYLSRYGL